VSDARAMPLLEAAAGLDRLDGRAVLLFDPGAGEVGPSTEVIAVVRPPDLDPDDPGAPARLGHPGRRVLIDVHHARRAIKLWMDWGDGVPPGPEKAVEVILLHARMYGGLHPEPPTIEKEIERAREEGRTELSLRDRRLASLPESIGGLPRLESLDLSYNVLEALPDAIGDLSGLRRLLLRNNRLRRLPESIGRLTRLHVLIASDNALDRLPDTIGRLAQLKLLDVSGNVLEGLPDSIGDLSSLALLILSRNRIRELPRALARIGGRIGLDLSENPISPSLEGLDLKEALDRLRAGPEGGRGRTG